MILVLFPLWIWVLILLDCVFILIAIDDDDEQWGTAATVSVLILLGVLQWFTEFKAFTWIYEHPWTTVTAAVIYFIIGAVWSVIKWWFSEKARVRRAKRDLGSHWQDRKTTTSRYKSTMLVWIGYWPFSLIWTLINDPFKRLVHWIYDELIMVYERITDRVWESEK